MKITYIENLPLDEQGTMLHPAYKWKEAERTEYCDSISKVGNLWYMFRGGFVYHSINPAMITTIEDAGVKAECKHYRDGSNPFTCKFIERDGRCFGAA